MFMTIRKAQNHWLYLAVGVIVLDQLTKYWAEHILGWRQTIEILPVFDFSLVHNTGAAFGILAGMGGWQHVFFVSFAVLVSLMLIAGIIGLKAHERHLAIAYALVIGGAIGNAIDRVVYQYVIDFIHWFYQDWHYPHFNIADMAIFIGACLLFCEIAGKPFLNIRTT